MPMPLEIWCGHVPLAAAVVVVEQLGFAQLKQPSTMHMIAVPHLMTGRWRKHLNQGADGYARLDDVEVWDLSCRYEALLIYFCLPFCSKDPKWEDNGKTCWPDFSGFCLNKKCQQLVQAAKGIFCANFYARHGNFAPCNGDWCRPCYTPLEVRNLRNFGR